MKSAWHLEWEFQIQYAGPFRAHVNAITKAFTGPEFALKRLALVAAETTKRLQELGRHIKESS